MVHGMKDKRCPLYQAEYIFNGVTTPDKQFVVQYTDHYNYIYTSEERLVREIDQIIKTGTVDQDIFSRAIITVPLIVIALALSNFLF